MKNPYVVGIAGGSASGKTTWCAKLEKELAEYSVKVFSMDEYFKPKNKRPVASAPITGISYLDDNHPETMDLPQLRKDIAQAKQQSYDVILVEGLLTLWDDAIAQSLDLKLFIDCAADERIVRRLRRNMAEWGLEFDEIAEVYLDLVRYRHNEYVEPSKWRADFILNGSRFSQPSLEILVGHIESQIKR